MTIRESNTDKGGRVPGHGQSGSLSAAADDTGIVSGGAGGGGAVHAFRWLIRQTRVTTLISLAIFIAASAVMNIMFTYFGVFEVGETWAYSEILPNATAIYMLVLGIVLPLYLEILMGQGATRHQFTVALLSASALTACALALINVVVALIFADFTVLSVLRWALSNWFFFLVGWLIVIGYQFRHVITAVASTLVGICLLTLWPFCGSYVAAELGKTVAVFFGSVPVLLLAVIGLVGSFALAAIIHVLTRRVSIKV